MIKNFTKKDLLILIILGLFVSNNFIPNIARSEVDVLSSFGEENISVLNDILRDIDKERQLQEFPTGGIIIWSGAISAIPDGWVICDGNNNTPNLTDRFVLHADADSGGTNDVGDTGGVSSVTLTAAQSGLVSHTHTWQMYNTAIGNNNWPVGGDGGLNPKGTGTTAATGGTSASSSHTNRDKYYSLAYIMKT